MQKVAIRFKDYEGLFYVVDNQGKRWVALRPLLAAIGADVEAELAMIRADNPLRFFVNDFDLAHYIDKQDTTTDEAEPCFFLPNIAGVFLKMQPAKNLEEFNREFYPPKIIREEIRLHLTPASLKDGQKLAGDKYLEQYLSDLLSEAISKETIQEIALKRIKK